MLPMLVGLSQLVACSGIFGRVRAAGQGSGGGGNRTARRHTYRRCAITGAAGGDGIGETGSPAQFGSGSVRGRTV